MKALIGVAMLAGAVLNRADQYVGWAVGMAESGYGTVIATSDSGATWTRQGSGQFANVDFASVCAVSPSTAWVGGNADNGYATVYVTYDGGATWTRKGFGAPALQNIDIGKLHVSSNHIWAIGMNAILLSMDDGATWTNLLPAAYTNITLQGVNSVDGRAVWVGGGGIAAGEAVLLHSADAGQTWQRQTNGAVQQASHILGISAINTQVVWAVGGDEFIVLRSNNGGATWSRQPSQGGLGDANEVSAIDPHTVFVAADNFVQWSTNGGLSWAAQNTPPYCMGIAAVDGRTAWAVVHGQDGTGSVWHTANGGASWERQALNITPLAPLWTVSFAREPISEPAGLCLALAAAVVCRCARAARAYLYE